MKRRGTLFAIAGVVIAVLAAIEMLDQEATIWNIASLVVGVALVVWGLMTARQAEA